MMTKYIMSRFYEAAKEHSYREYITDALFYHGQGKAHKFSWREQLKPKEPEKSPEVVLSEVIQRTGLVIS